MKSKGIKLVAGVSALCLVYAMSYVVLSAPEDLELMTSPPIRQRSQHFRVGGKLTTMFFAPLSWLDKAIRPSYWSSPGVPARETVPSRSAEPTSTAPFEF